VFFLLINEFQFDSYRLKRLDETYYEGEKKNVLIDYRCVYWKDLFSRRRFMCLSFVTFCNNRI